MAGPAAHPASGEAPAGRATPAPADRLVTMPFGRLLIVSWIGALLVGAAWVAAALALGRGTALATGGALGAGAVAAASTISILVMRPGRPKPLHRWPAVWIAASFVRLACTILGGLLLYSATPFGTAGLWLAVVMAYVAVMLGETRVYVLEMRRFDPRRVPSPSE